MDAALLPLDALAEAKVAERRREILEGKRSDSRDLLTLMRASEHFSFAAIRD